MPDNKDRNANDKESFSVSGDGYFVNHGTKKVNSCKMILDVKYQTIGHKDGTLDEFVQVFLREKGSRRIGYKYCETNVQLTMEEAKELLDVLLDITAYVSPDEREQNRNIRGR
jgi:hypothetical protein